MTKKDQRSAFRFPYKAKALFKPQWRTNQECMIRDVSEKGAYFVALEKLLIRSQVTLFLPALVLGEENVCVLTGRVARIETKTGKPVFGYGIVFDAPSTGTVMLLRELISGKERTTSRVEYKSQRKKPDSE